MPIVYRHSLRCQKKSFAGAVNKVDLKTPPGKQVNSVPSVSSVAKTLCDFCALCGSKKTAPQCARARPNSRLPRPIPRYLKRMTTPSSQFQPPPKQGVYPQNSAICILYLYNCRINWALPGLSRAFGGFTGTFWRICGENPFVTFVPLCLCDENAGVLNKVDLITPPGKQINAVPSAPL